MAERGLRLSKVQSRQSGLPYAAWAPIRLPGLWLRRRSVDPGWNLVGDPLLACARRDLEIGWLEQLPPHLQLAQQLVQRLDGQCFPTRRALLTALEGQLALLLAGGAIPPSP